MAKYAKNARTAAPVAKTAAAAQPLARTHEGGKGFVKDLRTELFSLAMTSFMAEDTFYEAAGQRDSRFVTLIEQLCLDVDSCDWLAAFIPWLRDEANMRSAATVAAVEYARNWTQGAQKSGREVIRETLTRADEPAEALAYWLAKYGKPIPYAIKRGIADAAVKLYTPYALNKYDSQGAALRPGDVIELTHPKPRDEAQADLFGYAIAKRHNRDEIPYTPNIENIRILDEWNKNPDRNNVPDLVTWESFSSHFAMNGADWEAVIPQMGYMARLRNLRNFENAGVNDATLNEIAEYIADPERVARSRQLPFRFYNAHVHASTRFSWPLEQAMRHSVANIPEFPGVTAILIDTSGSMGSRLSRNGTLTLAEAAIIFGTAVAARSTNAYVYQYASTCERVQIHNRDILKNAAMMKGLIGNVGHGTNTWPSVEFALRDIGKDVDRVMIFTDMQDHPSRLGDKIVPANVPVHVWDLGGYGKANIETGSNRYLHAGLSDKTFKVVDMLENLKPGRWPWEA